MINKNEKTAIVNLNTAVENAIHMIGSGNRYPHSFYPMSSGRFWPVWRDLSRAPGKKLLDIGCGVGFMSAVVSQLGFEVYSVDASKNINPDVIDRFHLNFCQINVESSPLPYADNSFDAVLLTEVLEHFNYSPLGPLQEIKRVLKPGGRLYLTTPNIASIFYVYTLLLGGNVYGSLKMVLENDGHSYNGQPPAFRDIHFRCYTVKEVRQLMDMIGMKVIGCRSLIRYDLSTRKILKRFLLYLLKLFVSITNSRLCGETIYVIAEK